MFCHPFPTTCFVVCGPNLCVSLLQLSFPPALTGMHYCQRHAGGGAMSEADTHNETREKLSFVWKVTRTANGMLHWNDKMFLEKPTQVCGRVSHPPVTLAWSKLPFPVLSIYSNRKIYILELYIQAYMDIFPLIRSMITLVISGQSLFKTGGLKLVYFCLNI